MYGTAERLLRLLSLLQARRDWPGADLATRLEVDVRTIRRDVERLRSLGYPVHATPGVAGGYRLGAGAALPPLLLDDDEAVAVAVGLRTAASGTVGGMVGGIEETSVRALAKLEQVLPARLRPRVGALQAATVALPGAGPTVDAEVLTVLATACRDQERLRFGYAGSSGAATDRSVEPLRLVCTGRRWYLVAFDLDRAAWRTFRADRIDGVPVPGFRFTPREPPAADLAEYVARQISTEVYPHRLVLRVAAPATALAHRIPPTAGVVEEVDEHSCLLRTGASNLDAVPYYLAQLGYDFVVEEAPPGLVERLREVAERFARAVG